MEKRWVTVREASRYLSLHEMTTRRLIDHGVIPASRIGRNIRVDMRKLNEQLERGMEPAWKPRL